MKSKTLFLTRAALLAAVLCILAPISIPIGPVPITLGVFAVMLAGTILNWKEAGAAVLVYLLLGVIGLPVFSSGKSGPAVLAEADDGRDVHLRRQPHVGVGHGGEVGDVIAPGIAGQIDFASAGNALHCGILLCKLRLREGCG